LRIGKRGVAFSDVRYVLLTTPKGEWRQACTHLQRNPPFM